MAGTVNKQRVEEAEVTEEMGSQIVLGSLGQCKDLGFYPGGWEASEGIKQDHFDCCVENRA